MFYKTTGSTVLLSWLSAWFVIIESRFKSVHGASFLGYNSFYWAMNNQ